MPPTPSERASTRVQLLTALAAVLVLVTGVVTVVVRNTSNASSERTSVTQTPPAETTTTVATTSPPTTSPLVDEPAVIREIRDQVARLRGLEWKAPLSVKVVSKAELARRLREVNARDADPARLAGEGDTYKLLHVIPHDLDYVKTIEDLYAAAVLGFYDPKTKEMFVRDPGGDTLEPTTRVAIAHELDHALTDQHFDFGPRLDALDKADRDEELAGLLALVEGDARTLDTRWATEHLSEEEQLAVVLGGLVDEGPTPEIPRFMLDQLQYPYTHGPEFVDELLDRGGWGAVNQAYARPPTSTEQILHPAAYFAGQGWAPPPLPDLAAATGCRRVHHGTLGEFQMGEVLETEVGENDGDAAARGWAGDAFQVVRCGAALGMVERWISDDVGAADRLVAALSRWAQGWSGSGEGPGADGRFGGPGGAGRILRGGNRVDLVLGADRATTDRVGAAVG